MTGLLFKNLLLLKKQAHLLVLFFVLYLVISVSAGNAGNLLLGNVIMLVCLIYSVSCISYDDQAKWHSYCRALPIPARSVVLSQYLFTVCSGLIGLALSALLLLLTALLLGEPFHAQALPGLLLALCCGFIMTAPLIPLAIRMGSERARLWMLVLVGLPTFGLSLVPEQTLLRLSDMLLWALPAAALLALAASYGISCCIYRKKAY